jgi:predicted nuclease with TOPRIM domain
MTDIVERLRERWADTSEEAADEIERLRAERDAHRDAHAAAQNVLDALYGERDRLREALRDVAPALKDARDRFAKMGDAVCATALTISLLTINAALGETGHE